MGRLSWNVRLALLALLLGALLLPAAGAAPLERAEVYFVDAARAMVESGDWLVPRYQGQPFFDKPPLVYWLIGGAFEAFGPTLAAARLVPALGALGAVLATVWLGGLLFDRERGLLAGLMLATSVAFVSFGRIAMSDMLLTALATAAFALVVRLDAGGGRRLAPLAGAVLGLGVLAKGPVALLLPGLGMLALGWSRRRLPASALWLFASALAFLLVAAPWFVAVYLRLGPEPLSWFFLRENLERFAGETYDSGRPAWYYLSAYLALGLPWSPLMPLVLLRAARGRPGREGARGLLLAWLGLMLVPLSLSRGKIDYYLLPLLPPVSLLTADFAASAWSRFERAWVRASAALLGLVAALLPLALLRFHEQWRPPAPAATLIAAAALISALALLAAARWPSPRRLAGALAGAVALLAIAALAVFVPCFEAAGEKQRLLQDLARELDARPDARLVFCEDPLRIERDLLFERRVPSLQRCDLWAPAASRLPFLVMLRERERRALMEIPGTRFAGWYKFMPAEAFTLDGLIRGVEPGRLALIANFETTDRESIRRAKREWRRRVEDAEEAAATGRDEGPRGAGKPQVP
ncbi:MAG: ArnT family glycosyltransferase [Vicinamibacteria bacterium]